MAALRPRAGPAFPDEFPVFPLTGALLLPRGKLPLNIFEPRYLAMVEDSLGEGRIFGMIQPNPARPKGPTGPALFRIGCLGRLTSFSEAEDGRYLITLTGLIRFTVAQELGLRRGYRRVRGDYGPFLADADPTSDSLGSEREPLIAELRAFFQRSGMDANWDAIARLSDDTLLTSLCMVCPFGALEKQAMLEAPTDLDRAVTLRALLRMGARSGDTVEDTPTVS